MVLAACAAAPVSVEVVVGAAAADLPAIVTPVPWPGKLHDEGSRQPCSVPVTLDWRQGSVARTSLPRGHLCACTSEAHEGRKREHCSAQSTQLDRHGLPDTCNTQGKIRRFLDSQQVLYLPSQG